MKEKELTVYRASGYHYTPIPRIILQGQWMQNLGFSIGDKIAITCQQDRILIVKTSSEPVAEEQQEKEITYGRF